MDPADLNGIRGASFTALRRELGWLSDAPRRSCTPWANESDVRG